METIIAGVFALLIGAVGCGTGVVQLRNRAALNGWRTTPGRVIERGTYQVNSATLSQGAFLYAPLVKYAYRVDARDFVNDSIHPKRIQIPQHNTQEWAQKRAASFADEVTVHYNPADPSESFLVQTPKLTLYVIIIASCFVLLYGVLLLLTGH